MGVPLAALAVQPPRPIDPLQQAAQVIGLRNAVQNQPLQQQALQQQVQGQGLQNQRLQLENQQTLALSKAYENAIKPDENGIPQIDPDAVVKSLQASQGGGAAIPGVLNGLTQYNKLRSELQNSAMELQQKQSDMLGFAARAVKSSGYDPRLAHTIFDTLPSSPQIQQIRALIDQNPPQFKQLVDSAILNSKGASAAQAEEEQAGARKMAAETGAREFEAKLPGGALYAPNIAGLEAQQRVGIESSPQAIQGAASKAAAEEAARQGVSLSPGVTAGKAAQEAATTEAKTGVENKQKMTADEARRSDLANNMNENLDKLQDIVKRRPDLFGPAAGRITALKQFVGTNDPDVAALQTIKEQMGMAMVGAHAMRNAQHVETAANSIVNAYHNTPQAVLSSIQQARNSLGTFIQDVQGQPIRAQAPQAASNSPRFTVGQQVSIKGKPMTITAVHPDGTFDAK